MENATGMAEQIVMTTRIPYSPFFDFSFRFFVVDYGCVVHSKMVRVCVCAFCYIRFYYAASYKHFQKKITEWNKYKWKKKKMTATTTTKLGFSLQMCIFFDARHFFKILQANLWKKILSLSCSLFFPNKDTYCTCEFRLRTIGCSARNDFFSIDF